MRIEEQAQTAIRSFIEDSTYYLMQGFRSYQATDDENEATIQSEQVKLMPEFLI